MIEKMNFSNWLLIWSIRFSLLLLVTVVAIRLQRKAYTQGGSHGPFADDKESLQVDRAPSVLSDSRTNTAADPRSVSTGDSLIDLLWALGALLAAVHLLAAFHFVHHWSHTLAVLETARRTQAQLGFAVGAGVWFNYAFVAIWWLDVLAVGALPHLKRLPWFRETSLIRFLRVTGSLRIQRCWRWLVDGYLLSIAFPATVIFESGAIRWAGIVMTVVLVVLGWRSYVPKRS
jgi:hypothetical protein